MIRGTTELAREPQHSTTEQEAVATWPFGYHSIKGCVLRDGQVATLYMKGRPHGSNLELFYHFKYRPKESPMKTYYVGMDVHRATIALAVLNGAGKVVMESTIETGAERGLSR